jgi:hypothetical protein
MNIRLVALAFIMALSFNISAEENSWDISVGTDVKMKYSLLGGETTGYRSDFDENFISVAYNHGLYKYLSAYAKVFHYRGDSTAKVKWNKAQQEWVDIKSPFDTDGTYVGAGLKLHTNQARKVSAGIYLAYGYLNNPDNILNSGHQQFNLGAEVRYKVSDKWAVFANWEHLSNGRQVFSLGDKTGDRYPNNGRDFLGLGIRYTP